MYVWMHVYMYLSMYVCTFLNEMSIYRYTTGIPTWERSISEYNITANAIFQDGNGQTRNNL